MVLLGVVSMNMYDDSSLILLPTAPVLLSSFFFDKQVPSEKIAPPKEKAGTHVYR